MKKNWVIMSVHPVKGAVLIAEAESIEAANVLLNSGIIEHKFKRSLISWVISRKEYEDKYICNNELTKETSF